MAGHDVDSVATWLQRLGLDRYLSAFADNDVDLEVLEMLSEADLEKLGVSLGHRKKMLKAIDERKLAGEARGVEPPSGSAASSEAGERRQLTVLFCDMVGFTELASRVDPEVLQRIIRSYEDTCAGPILRYEGFVFQRLGDGIVAFFGYPHAHEREAERAIRSGLEILEALELLEVPEAGRIEARIGIATGMVVVSSRDKGAVGETMNLAARLQSIADPGSVVVSEAVRSLTGGAFVYQDLGAQALKGIRRRTPAFRVLGPGDAASRFETKGAPLIGREQELGLLLERWRQSQEGEGQVVLLSGEPGIGKSRLVSALRERLEAQGASSLNFQCSPFYTNSAFHPMIDNLDRALRFERSDSTDARLDKLEALVVGRYHRPISEVRFLAEVLSLPGERYGKSELSAERQKQETIRALVELAEAAALQAPTVMLFEDAHWADPSTLEALALLIERVRTRPLLVVLTYRPEFNARWSEHGHVTALDLSKLTQAQCRSIVNGLTDNKTLPGNLLEEILRRTDGIPMFVEELTRSILESGELIEHADHYDLAGRETTITIPTTLRDSLEARLDRLPLVKSVAQIGAVIGREFGRELIQAVAPIDAGELDEGLARLVDSGLAFCRARGEDTVYTFKHALIQDAAYDSLLKTRRQELHRDVARVIERDFQGLRESEPELLAHHFTEAGLAEPAVDYWGRAGAAAAGKSADVEAAAHLGRALELLGRIPESPERDEQELDLRVAYATALLTLRGYTAPETNEAYAAAKALSDRLGDMPQIFPITYGRWAHLLVKGDFNANYQTAAEIHPRAEKSSDSLARLIGNRMLGSSLITVGRPAEARRYLEKAIELYQPDHHSTSALTYAQDARVMSLTYDGLALAYLGLPAQARRRLDDALEWARQLDHVHSILWTLLHAEWLEQVLADGDRLAAHLEETRTLNAKDETSIWNTLAAGFHGWVSLDEGNCELAVAQLESAIVNCEQRDMSWGLGLWLPSLATGYGRLGKIDIGIETVERCLDLIDRQGGEIHRCEALRVEGELQALRGNTERAVVLLERAIATAARQQAKLLELRAGNSLARLFIDSGRPDEAHCLLEPQITHFEGAHFEGAHSEERLDFEEEMPDLQLARSLLLEISEG